MRSIVLRSARILIAGGMIATVAGCGEAALVEPEQLCSAAVAHLASCGVEEGTAPATCGETEQKTAAELLSQECEELSSRAAAWSLPWSKKTTSQCTYSVRWFDFCKKEDDTSYGKDKLGRKFEVAALPNGLCKTVYRSGSNRFVVDYETGPCPKCCFSCCSNYKSLQCRDKDGQVYDEKFERPSDHKVCWNGWWR